MQSHQGKFTNYNFQKDTQVETPAIPNAPSPYFSYSASALMSPQVISIKEDTKLDKTWNKMKEINTHHLPVTDENGKLIGVVSDRDLARIGEQIQVYTVKEVMTTDVIAATDTTPLKEILHVMVTEGISSVPIIDDSNKLIGIVTSTDVLKHFYNLS